MVRLAPGPRSPVLVEPFAAVLAALAKALARAELTLVQPPQPALSVGVVPTGIQAPADRQPAEGPRVAVALVVFALVATVLR